MTKQRLPDPSSPHWLLRPTTIRLLWGASLILLAVLVATDAFIEEPSLFGLDGTFGFHAWFGFGTCALMGIGSKVIGVFLKRGEDYYD